MKGQVYHLMKVRYSSYCRFSEINFSFFFPYIRLVNPLCFRIFMICKKEESYNQREAGIMWIRGKK